MSILKSYAVKMDGVGAAKDAHFEVYITARSVEHAEEIVENMKSKLLLYSTFATVSLTLSGDTLEEQYPEELPIPLKH